MPMIRNEKSWQICLRYCARFDTDISGNIIVLHTHHALFHLSSFFHQEIEDILGSKKKDILKNEFHTFVLLEFSLNVTADEIRPYFLYFRGALDLVIPFGEQWA